MKKIALIAVVLIALTITANIVWNRGVVLGLVPAIHTRVSVNNTGDNQGGNNYTASGNNFQLSADGRFVVFPSLSSNLVNNDTNNKWDVFVRDLDAGVTTRVSTSLADVQTNADSGAANSADGVAISQTGRYVSFSSRATNLIDGTTISGAYSQIYLRDTKDNTLTIVTQKTDGTLGNAANAAPQAISNDGRFVLWSGGKNTNILDKGSSVGGGHIYLTDMKDRGTQLLSPKDSSDARNSGSVPKARMNCDGSFIVASSIEQHTDDDTDSVTDIFLFDLRSGLTVTNLTVASDLAAEAPSISCNGNYITFASKDPVFDSMVPPTHTQRHVYLYDRISEEYSVVDVSASGAFSSVDSNGDTGIDDRGNVVYSGNNAPVLPYSTRTQQLLKHRESGELELVTRNAFSNSAATQAVDTRASLSADGKRTVYTTTSPGSSLFVPPSGTYTDTYTYDSNGHIDVVMSLTGL